MAKTTLQELSEFGQSIWLDYISRSLIETGKLKNMIEHGLRGMTSNPSIFDKAISTSDDYDESIFELFKKGLSAFEIYDELTVKDIQEAADIFMPVYESTNGLDGYVSLEINPNLAYKTEETIAEGKRLYEKVNRPNLMLKVPATLQGFPAVEELVSYGYNVNVTLIFSLEQYKRTAYSYIKGIQEFLDSGGDASRVQSVASVFVSRVDTVIDKLLDEKLITETDEDRRRFIPGLKGQGAVSNCRFIYKECLEIFYANELKELLAQGVNLQRVLWGSTSTKNPAYSDTKYIEELIGKSTVNTVPQDTIEAFLDHGKVKEVLGRDANESHTVINKLLAMGINIEDVCNQLLKDGVLVFEKAFNSLLEHIDAKAKKLA